MEGSRTTHEMDFASRKAEEAAWRRFQAAGWLESLVGPIGVSTHPSEREFVSCLRNGFVLFNAIIKIHPGSVPKVVENHSQPLSAYQYFENVRNFLVAVEELKLPAFEASDIERDTLEAGSAAKVVDCILALKSYHEWKQMCGGNGHYKHVRSPMVVHSASRVNSRSLVANPSDSNKRLDIVKIESLKKALENKVGQKAPTSPISSTYKSRVAIAASRTQIAPFQPTRTPEPARKEVQIMMQSGLRVSKDSEPSPSSISSGKGKGSQIRKSLRTIGKLINGSEKRNQQKLMEARTPIKGSNNADGGRSPPLSANERAMRRSSVIGKSSDSCSNETRNAKTPLLQSTSQPR